MTPDVTGAHLTGARIRMTARLCAVSLMLTASGCGGTQRGIRTITLSENLGLVELAGVFKPGRRFLTSYAGGGEGQVELSSGGALSVDYEGRTGSGTWQIVNDRLCANWNDARYSGQRCYRVYGSLFRSDAVFRMFGPDGAHEVDMILIGAS